MSELKNHPLDSSPTGLDQVHATFNPAATPAKPAITGLTKAPDMTNGSKGAVDKNGESENVIPVYGYGERAPLNDPHGYYAAAYSKHAAHSSDVSPVDLEHAGGDPVNDHGSDEVRGSLDESDGRPSQVPARKPRPSMISMLSNNKSREPLDEETIALKQIVPRVTGRHVYQRTKEGKANRGGRSGGHVQSIDYQEYEEDDNFEGLGSYNETMQPTNYSRGGRGNGYEDHDMDDVYDDDESAFGESVGRVPGNQGFDLRSEDGEYNNDETMTNDGVFVPEDTRSNPYRVQKGRSGFVGSRRFRHEDLEGQSQSPLNRPIRRSVGGEFELNNPGKHLAPSRYSGTSMPWGVNQVPPMVKQSEVSDASLKKRGLTRGKSDTVCKRGYGANDPENIKIVNMKENDGLTFEQIKTILNEERVKQGKNPTLSACGVNSRYNRTAPLIFASAGKEFIPLSQRRKLEGKIPSKMVWNDHTDVTLVNLVNEYNKQKWQVVAQRFNEQTGENLTASQIATRHGLL